MNELQTIINKYEIGNNDERVNFMHSGIAAQAFAEIREQITDTIVITEAQFNWLTRLGQCTRNAGIWAAAGTLDGGYGFQFVPAKL